MSAAAGSGVEVADAAGQTVAAVDDEFQRAGRAGLPVDGHLANAVAK